MAVFLSNKTSRFPKKVVVWAAVKKILSGVVHLLSLLLPHLPLAVIDGILLHRSSATSAFPFSTSKILTGLMVIH